MLKQITLDKASELYHKGLDIYLCGNDNYALPWNNQTDSNDFSLTLGYYGDDVRAFIAFNVCDSSNI